MATNWEDMPDYAALWLQSCTRLGYQTFESWMRRNHPDVHVSADIADRAAQLHEVLLCKGMEAIEREATPKSQPPDDPRAPGGIGWDGGPGPGPGE